MSYESYLGEITYFAGNFAPRGWMACEGQALSIAQNSALFSLLGTTYGGDGVTTFNLPDLRNGLALGGATFGASARTDAANVASGSTATTGTLALTACICVSGLFPPR